MIKLRSVENAVKILQFQYSVLMIIAEVQLTSVVKSRLLKCSCVGRKEKLWEPFVNCLVSNANLKSFMIWVRN